MRRLAIAIVPIVLAAGLLPAAAAEPADAPMSAPAEVQSGVPGDLPVYKMVRTLEYVQDSIVNGDHASMDMQRFLLTAIDAKLRAAKPGAFDDPRMVNAALIYAMSGGNPDTLAVVAARDAEGYFDDRLVNALSDYFSGNPAAAAQTLVKLEPGFRNTAIGPYLTLVTANALAASDPGKALTLFDWVRLMAPGTILEESALRRAIGVAQKARMIDRGMGYCGAYARRFLHSPYAGQFADLLVGFVVDHDDVISRDDLMTVLAGMDPARQREIYLRIARQAAIVGKRALADDAARRAATLEDDTDTPVAALAGLYASISDLPTADAAAAVERIRAIAPSELSERDRRLRAAALSVGAAVTQLPTLSASLGQAGGATTHPAPAAGTAPASFPPSMQPIPSRPRKTTASGIDPQQLDGFVDARRERLKEIDALLGKDKR